MKKQVDKTIRIYPDGDIQSNWTPTPGPDNYEAINEDISSYDENDYVYTSSDGIIDEYSFTDIAESMDVGTEVILRGRCKINDGANTARIRVDITFNGVPITGSPVYISGNYGNSQTIAISISGLYFSKTKANLLQAKITSDVYATK